LANNDKLDQDFNNFNQDIKQVSEKELNRIREEFNALKDKANTMSKVLLDPIHDEEKII
jgi:hypothetical protein